jgi:hypothetical protein
MCEILGSNQHPFAENAACIERMPDLYLRKEMVGRDRSSDDTSRRCSSKVITPKPRALQAEAQDKGKREAKNSETVGGAYSLNSG